VATINFGAEPGSNQATVAVAGQGTILATSSAQAFLMAEPSADHTANDQAYAATVIGLTCSVPVAGVGFNIIATTNEKLTGTVTVRWFWI
jgi:hypothetical protein